MKSTDNVVLDCRQLKWIVLMVKWWTWFSSRILNSPRFNKSSREMMTAGGVLCLNFVHDRRTRDLRRDEIKKIECMSGCVCASRRRDDMIMGKVFLFIFVLGLYYPFFVPENLLQPVINSRLDGATMRTLIHYMLLENAIEFFNLLSMGKLFPSS